MVITIKNKKIYVRPGKCCPHPALSKGEGSSPSPLEKDLG
jgi:hypothetical protein